MENRLLVSIAALSSAIAAIAAVIHILKLRDIKAKTGSTFSKAIFPLLTHKHITGLPVNYFTLPFVGDIIYLLSLGNKDVQHRLHARLGDSFATIVLGKPRVILSSTKLVDELMYSNHLKLTNGVLEATRNLFGATSLGMLPIGELHKQKRNTLLKFVGIQGMQRWFPLIARTFHDAVLFLAQGEEFKDAYAVLQKAVAKVMFVVTVGEAKSDPELIHKLEALLPTFGKAVMCLPFQQAYKDGMAAGNEMEALIRKEMEARRGVDGSHRIDLIQAILDVEGPDPDARSPLGPIWASLDSTYAFSVRQLEFLTSRPDVLLRLRTEVQAKFGNLGLLHPDCSPEQFLTMPYLCAVSHEIVRCLNELTTLDRIVLEDISLDNDRVRIPKDYEVSVSVFEMIANNPVTQRAQDFDPDRWLPPRNEKEVDPYRTGGGEGSFGFGLRTCPGRNLAVLELRAFLVELCYYTWELQKPAVYEWVPFPTPKDGLWVRGRRDVALV